MVMKITTAQQQIIDAMQKGSVLSRTVSTKYVPFNMNPEHSGRLRNPRVHHVFSDKNILVSTIKAMETKGLIAEESRYVCSSGYIGEHETEMWCINYKLNLCAHCNEAPITDNGLYCQTCAEQIGNEYMDEWEKQNKEKQPA